MKATDKALQLKKHKWLATGLFLLMLVVYVLMTYLSKQTDAGWIGYVKAFSEAAMVGALADWFAVTALFHHPMGIPIPHTNLIENSKKKIGDNLGNFVVSNFLNAANIRPYISKLKVSAYAAQWLSKEKNKNLVVTEAARLLNDLIQKADDEVVVSFLATKANSLLDALKLNAVVSNALLYFIDNNEHDKFITLLAGKIKDFIYLNETLVKEKVRAESFFFIPRFVDNKLAEKISNGLASFFDEIENDPDHKIRKEITEQLYGFAESLQNDPKWREEFNQLRNKLLPADKLDQYARDAWFAVKTNLQEELINNDSRVLKYFGKSIEDIAFNLNNDPALQQKIDGWIQYNVYNLILRNTEQMGLMISNTVGNWKGRELSQKLELEVGKDLQFIRINGTIVGGLVGLLIHVITKFFL
jgi:uncharacterized membrane-anchored protein YjiN (DUF445 family)